MTLTLKQLRLRFKRHNINHPSGPNFRAIEVTDDNKDRIALYINDLGGEARIAQPTGKLNIFQKVTRKAANDKIINTAGWRVAEVGDRVVQFHDASWARLKPAEFEAILAK